MILYHLTILKLVTIFYNFVDGVGCDNMTCIIVKFKQ